MNRTDDEKMANRISQMSVYTLKKNLKELGLSVSGNKQDLIERLIIAKCYSFIEIIK